MSYPQCKGFLEKFYADMEKLIPEEYRTKEVIEDLHARVPMLLEQFETVGLGDDRTCAMLASAPDQEGAIAAIARLQLAAITINTLQSSDPSPSPEEIRATVDRILAGTSAVEKAAQGNMGNKKTRGR